MRAGRIPWLAAGLLLALGVQARPDPLAAFVSAQDPSALREAALRLGRALDGGCCFGQERGIAEKVAERLAACPRDPALVSALAAAMDPIATAVAIEDTALARRVFIDLPLSCLKRNSAAWQAYAAFPMGPGLALAPFAPHALTEAIGRLVASADQDPARIGRVLEWLLNLPPGVSLPPLDVEVVDALIDSAGNHLYDLTELFSGLPGRSGTEALLRLAERRDLQVPPELAQWADAGDIRAMALRKLEPRRLDEEALDRVARLAEDPDYQVADAARHILDVEYSPPAYLAEGENAPDLEQLLRTLGAGKDPERAQAASLLAEHLLEHPEDQEVRRALREAAEKDTHALVRARAWRALLATNDPQFTWQRIMTWVRSPASRARALETLKLIETPLPSQLLEDLPDALVETLLETAEDRQQDTRLRLEALGVARRLGEWALDILSRAGQPDTDQERARAFLSRFVATTEPRVRALLADPDPGIRRAAAYWFAAIPARDPATAEALLAALDDPDEYVRDSAAMALAAVRAAPPGFAIRLEARIARGDPDANVVRKLRDAMGTALCMDPQARERLAAVILHRAGDRYLRQALAKRCRLDREAARALLDRIGPDLMPTLLEEGFMERFLQAGELDIEALVRAEEDPPPWTLITRMVPAEVRDVWLLEKAEDPALAWRKRMRLLRLVEDRQAPEIREVLRALLMEGMRTRAIRPEDFLDVFVPSLGYEAIRTLAEAFADDPDGLARAARLVERAADLAADREMRGVSSGMLPEPGAEDLPWIAKLISKAAADPPRLGLLVRLLRLYDLGQDPELQRQAWQSGITPALIGAMRLPGGCEAVKPAIHSLLGRMIPPHCGQSR